MLVLTRKPNQRVVLRLPDGTLVTVLVVGLRGDGVRLGFEAPPGVRILRDEIALAIACGSTADRFEAERCDLRFYLGELTKLLGEWPAEVGRLGSRDISAALETLKYYVEESAHKAATA